MDKRSKNEFIVLTTINSPTKAVKVLAKNKNNNVIVIGDSKTPGSWNCNNTNFISLQSQTRLNYELVRHLPNNHYCRKMLGYLVAIEQQAEYIIDIDDDNIPYTDWSFPSFEGTYKTTLKNKGFTNVYTYFTRRKIWPRGLPLRYIDTYCLENNKKRVKIGVWQGLADADPDVDAIYRLTNNTSCYFNNKAPIVLEKNTITPFNSQNTKFRKELFSLLYLPIFVTFRFTDILRGLVAQPIMWQHGYHLGFTKATVTQVRNPHDFMKDFISEIPMYIHSEKVLDVVNSSINSKDTIQDNMYNAYQALCQAKIVESKEVKGVTSWLNDLSRINCF
jgi:hypothetical protein